MASGRARATIPLARFSPATTLFRCPSSAISNCGCIAMKGTCDAATPATISAMAGSSSVTVLSQRRDVRAQIFAHRHRGGEQKERIDAHLVEPPDPPIPQRALLFRGQIVTLQGRFYALPAATNEIRTAADIAQKFIQLIQAHKHTSLSPSFASSRPNGS